MQVPQKQEASGPAHTGDTMPLNESIFSLKCFAFPTIQPAVSWKKRVFHAHFWPGGSVLPDLRRSGTSPADIPAPAEDKRKLPPRSRALRLRPRKRSLILATI